MRYELLGRHPGLRVSELVLGAGMFGTKWGYGGGLLTSKYRKGRKWTSGRHGRQALHRRGHRTEDSDTRHA